MHKGRLIVFEGPEGAGKSTQLRLLAERLRASGIDTLVLREPGGTPFGDAIRDILLDPDRQISPAAEAMLFMASRAELVHRRIDPALEAGVVVLMDRFFLSTYAYQIAARGLSEDGVRAANALATAGLVPDLTLAIDLPSGEGMARAAKRASHDRIEGSGDAFHAKVERAFAEFGSEEWQRAHPECGRIVRIDGRGTPGEVSGRVSVALAQGLPDTFGVLAEAAGR